MPLYQYRCDCGVEGEHIQTVGASPPSCPRCEKQMERVMTYPVMWKIRGLGGYPSRRKFVSGSAPYTTRTTKAWGDHNPDEVKDYGFNSKANKES